MSAQSVQTMTRTREQEDGRWIEPVEPPPLNSGDRLTRAEFERRYHAHPEIKKAELIEGVVYVPSPIRFEKHSEPHGHLITWRRESTSLP